jgi:hypothetical protein
VLKIVIVKQCPQKPVEVFGYFFIIHSSNCFQNSNASKCKNEGAYGKRLLERGLSW